MDREEGKYSEMINGQGNLWRIHEKSTLFVSMPSCQGSEMSSMFSSGNV